VIFKFRFFPPAGDHTHIQMRAGANKQGALPLAGEITLRNSEVEAFKQLLRRGSGDGGRVILESDSE